jgi:alpha-mannosidase
MSFRRQVLLAGLVLATIPALLLSAAAQTSLQSDPHKDALDGLQRLVVIDQNAWEFHPGATEDIPGDSASWQPLNVNASGSVPGWLRRTIEIPAAFHGYSPAGAKLELDVRLRHEQYLSYGIFVNGVLYRDSEQLEPIVLTTAALPGQRFTVLIRLLGGTEKFTLTRANLLVTPAGRPDPGVVREEILSAKLLANLIPDKADAERTIGDAVAAIDFAPLDRGDQNAFDASLRAAQQKLQVLNPQMKQYGVRLAGNSHIDMAWLWPWSETVEVVRNTWRSALKLMEQYPDFTYSHSSAAAYEWMEERYPDLFQQIQQRVKEGRWELLGGNWVEADMNVPDGESLVRQLLEGKRYFRQKFGVDIRNGWTPDSFGYSWQLPQIYRKSGIDTFVTQKMAWNDTTQIPYKLFWWQGLDGTRLLTYFPDGYANPIEPPRIAKAESAWIPQMKYPTMLYLFGVGDHGGGPTRRMLDTIREWQAPDMVYPKMQLGTIQPYLDELHKAPTMPVWNDELYFEYHRGIFTTQAETKKANRRSEALLLSAEKYSALASLMGFDYPADALRDAWHKVLFNQFHDIAAGSGIHDVYVDALRDYDVVKHIGDEAVAAATGELLAHINTSGEGVPLVVFNPLSWSRTDVVEAEVQLPSSARSVAIVDSRGSAMTSEVVSHDAATSRIKVRFIARDVPSLGYEVFRVFPDQDLPKASSTLHAAGTTVENEFVRIAVDPQTGCVTSIFDKQHNREALAPKACGNQLQVWTDKPKDWDAWNIDPGYWDLPHWELMHAEEVRLLPGNGPATATLRVRQKFGSSEFTQDITMYSGIPRVDVKFHADWHEQHKLLKVAFPLAAQNSFATYEIPYGAIQRPTTRNTPAEQAKFEVPALRWADLSDQQSGFSLLNDAKYGYDTLGNVMRLTLLRGPTWPDPVADQGEHSFTYSLYPHAGGWREAGTMRRGYELNYPLLPMPATPHTGPLPAEYSFISIDVASVILTVVKKAETPNNVGKGADSSDRTQLVLRFYETDGKPSAARVNLPTGATSAIQTNLMEKEEQPLSVTGAALELTFKPYEIKTVKVSFTATSHTQR